MLRARAAIVSTTTTGVGDSSKSLKISNALQQRQQRRQRLSKTSSKRKGITTTTLFLLLSTILLLSMSIAIYFFFSNQQQQQQRLEIQHEPHSFEEEEDILLYDKNECDLEIITKNLKKKSSTTKKLIHYIIQDHSLSELCSESYEYEKREEPPNSWIKDIDWYHFRYSTSTSTTTSNDWDLYDYCHVQCIDLLVEKLMEKKTKHKTKRKEVMTTLYNEWLRDASSVGLTRVVRHLLKISSSLSITLNPLYTSTPLTDDDTTTTTGLNSIQEAIRGGYVDIVDILTRNNRNMIIDQYDRTITDYIQLKGSPIRPLDAKRVLGITVVNDDKKKKKKHHYNDHDSGWSQETSIPFDDDECDIEIMNDLTRNDFFKDYFMTGRSFLLRNHVPKNEMRGFYKERWDTDTNNYHLNDARWQVGPTAYPSLTDQDYCIANFTISDLEKKRQCDEMPNIPMEVAFHPENDDDFHELWPMYNHMKDDSFYTQSGWRKLTEFFGNPEENDENNYEDDLAWQIFFGGDTSGATLHWHNAALNNLYVGTKQWRITPPYYRGFTGMPAFEVQEYLDQIKSKKDDQTRTFPPPDATLKCIQHSGDLMYIPEHWGHSTLSHGFTIGAAVIIPTRIHRYQGT